MEMEQKDCSTKVDKLIEKHAWIASEKQLFGKNGTDYDFASRDLYRAREELEKLQAEQSGYVILIVSFFPIISSLKLLLRSDVPMLILLVHIIANPMIMIR